MASVTPYGRTSGPAVGQSAARATRPARPASRLDWVDLVKGAAILLVALFHAGRLSHQAGLVGETWIQVNQIFSMVRMPVFFAASGLFLASVLRRSWSDLWRTRLSLLVWPFAVWLLLRFGWFWLVPLPSRPSENDPARLLAALWAPANGLWFLHALVVFTVLAKVTLRVPATVQLATAGAVSAALLGPWTLPWDYPERLGSYYVFFVGAGLLGPRLRAAVATARPGTARRWTVALGGVCAAYVLAPGVLHDLLRLPLAVVAVMTAFLVASRASGTWTGRALTRLGGLTLPVYVAHLIVLGGLVTLLLSAEVQVLGTAHEAWLLPALTAVAVPVSLLVHTVLTRARLGVLYAPPAWFRSGVPRPTST
jgi:uncharacterized membrane protein YcfT